MSVVHVLPDEGVGLHGSVGVHLRHVDVVYEVDQPFRARRAVVPARLLLERLLQHRCIVSLYTKWNFNAKYVSAKGFLNNVNVFGSILFFKTCTVHYAHNKLHFQFNITQVESK